MKQVGEFWAVMMVGHLWDKQVSSAQILMSCIALTWYQPILLGYNSVQSLSQVQLFATP